MLDLLIPLLAVALLLAAVVYWVLRIETKLEKSEEQIKESLRDTFKIVAVDLLREMHGDLLNTSEGRLKASYQDFKTLTAPLGETLKNLEQQTQNLESGRKTSDAVLKESLEGIKEQHQAILRLKAMFSNPQKRGLWGERTWRNIVDAAGMTQHCDFETQVRLPDGTRPDFIVKVGGKRFLAVDSKVPMDAYMDAYETQEAQERESGLKKHAEAVRKHIHALGSKSYHKKLTHEHETPAFVILFMPHEAGLVAALQTDGRLLADAEQHGVLLASPTTLLALLKTAACVWREENLAHSAREALAEAGKVYEALASFLTHFSDLGKEIEKTRKKYNETVGSLESRLLPRARKLQEKLGQEDLDYIETLKESTRELKPEKDGL